MITLRGVFTLDCNFENFSLVDIDPDFCLCPIYEVAIFLGTYVIILFIFASIFYNVMNILYIPAAREDLSKVVVVVVEFVSFCDYLRITVVVKVFTIFLFYCIF